VINPQNCGSDCRNFDGPAKLQVEFTFYYNQALLNLLDTTTTTHDFPVLKISLKVNAPTTITNPTSPINALDAF